MFVQEHLKTYEMKAQKKFNCVICTKEKTGFGNNPQPVKQKGKCCDDCNLLWVIPARVNLMYLSQFK